MKRPPVHHVGQPLVDAFKARLDEASFREEFRGSNIHSAAVHTVVEWAAAIADRGWNVLIGSASPVDSCRLIFGLKEAIERGCPGLQIADYGMGDVHTLRVKGGATFLGVSWGFSVTAPAGGPFDCALLLGRGPESWTCAVPRVAAYIQAR